LTADTTMNPNQLCEFVVTVLEDMKGQQIEVIDLTDRNSFADYLVIASGTSTRQVKAMADRLVEQAKLKGVRPMGIEGEREGEWVLVDLCDVVVHLMLPQTRAFYNLEKLWSAPPSTRSTNARG
jgi:ribosome-associated protein